MRKTHAGYWFSILLFYIYFFTLSLLAVSMLDSLDHYNPLTYTLVVAASLFILSTIQTAIHEAGHLLFGLCRAGASAPFVCTAGYGCVKMENFA